MPPYPVAAEMVGRLGRACDVLRGFSGNQRVGETVTKTAHLFNRSEGKL